MLVAEASPVRPDGGAAVAMTGPRGLSSAKGGEGTAAGVESGRLAGSAEAASDLRDRLRMGILQGLALGRSRINLRCEVPAVVGC